MKSFKIVLLALALMLVPAIVAAQTDSSATDGSGLDAALIIDHEAVTVGDVVDLQLSVTHPAGWRVLMPTLDANWGDLEIIEQHLPRIITNEDGSETTLQQIEAQVFAPGAYQTLPLTLTIVDDQGVTQPYPVSPAALNVRSVLVEGDTTLRDIKPQANFTIETTTNPTPIIVGLGAFGLGALAVVVVLRKRGKGSDIDNRTPAERANDTLDALEPLELADQATVKIFYAGVSQALRRYLAETVDIPMLEQTTNQIWGALQETAIPAEEAQALAKLLKVCDDVKFAPTAPDPDTTAQLTNRARQSIAEIERALATEEAAA